MSPAPICMAATESVSAAAKAMKRHGIGNVVVLAGGRLSGLLTDRDITIRVLADGRDPLTTRIGDICSAELVMLGPQIGFDLFEPGGRHHIANRIRPRSECTLAP